MRGISNRLAMYGALALLVLLPVAPGALPAARALRPLRRVNAPYFAQDIQFKQSAVFWLGQVTPTTNYADVRVAYNDEQLWVHVTVFDRRLWYDTAPSPTTLTDWDAVSLLIAVDGGVGTGLTTSDYRLVSELNWWEDLRTPWQGAWRGSAGSWLPSPIAFSTGSGWRGDAPNTDRDDRGWNITFRIPFASLGQKRAPTRGAHWGFAVLVHDRDDAARSPIADQVWPERAEAESPATWGQLVFGLPVYAPTLVTPGGVTTIRHGLNGVAVQDGMVGGAANCGSGMDDWWTQWGNTSYPTHEFFNVQNQYDVADWPCFSKYFSIFPLDGVPQGKTILSATLHLRQFGNAGAGWDPGPTPSYLQVFEVGGDWSSATLTWNDAPMAVRNLGGAWVAPLGDPVPREGVDRQWDVSGAVAEAYGAGQPLRLAVYSADGDYHSGRYFRSSKYGDAAKRPTLVVRWGEPGTKALRTLLPYTTR